MNEQHPITMPNEPLITITDANKTNGAADEPPLHSYAVSLLYVKQTPDETDPAKSSTDWRHMIMEVQSEDEPGSEWVARKLAEADSQLPEGFIFSSSVALKIG